MLKETKTPKLIKLFSKDKIVSEFNLNSRQTNIIQMYINQISKYNKHTNIVGRSTLINPWSSHVLDSIQISRHIKNNKSSILDMGTGAGLPGIILAIANYKNVSIIDSNFKKIKFVKAVCKKLNIKANIYHQRIETLINMKFDFLISRALSSLNKLFFYSHNFLSSKTVMIFLKGKQVNNEILEANKKWKFNYKLYQSLSNKQGSIIIIKGLKKTHG